MKPHYPILSIEAAREYEEKVLGKDPGCVSAAMNRAGRSIGESILGDYLEVRPWPPEPRVVILAGKGLNTGDALVATARLREDLPGLRARVLMTAPEEAWNPLARESLGRLREWMGPDLETVEASAADFGSAPDTDVVIDGLYGLGFKPPLREGARELLRAVNGNGSVRLRAAVDVPSGVGGEVDEDAFVADFTYIPGVAKAPVFAPENQSKVGRIRFLEMEPFLDQPAKAPAFLAPPCLFREMNGLRPALSDKRSFGHCLLLGGSRDMPGAILMASRAALQAGAGLVTTLVPGGIAGHGAGGLPEAMWRSLPLRSGGQLDVGSVSVVAELARKAQALLIGPGLQMDKPTAFVVARIVRETRLPLVLDASALTQEILAAVLGRPLDAPPVVLTPHRGEFARLLGRGEDPTDEAALQRFCTRFRIAVVLKGTPNLLADGTSLIRIPSGGPVLARGGSGDILAGMLVTLLAQDPQQAGRAALRAVTWHGAAADALARERGQQAVRTTELLDYLAPVLRG
jgi:NAD(P)H-hydrate epimerase